MCEISILNNGIIIIDIINLVMTNVNEGTIHWDADFFVE